MQISKKAIAVITLAAVALPLAGCANTQKTDKIAVVDYQTVLANHPDRKDAEKKLEDAYRDIQKQAMEKQNDSSISQEDKMQQMQEFQTWVTFLRDHAADADSRKGGDPTEGPKHYIDIDNSYKQKNDLKLELGNVNRNNDYYIDE